MVTDINSAELIKHAANSSGAEDLLHQCILATCDASGADKMIGRSFLNSGLGYGGSSFPKDLAAFIPISDQLGVSFNLLKEVQRVNQVQLDRFLKKIRDSLWVLKDKRIGVWGLTFKPDTDDVRSSAAIVLGQPSTERRRYRPGVRSKRGRESHRIEWARS